MRAAMLGGAGYVAGKPAEPGPAAATGEDVVGKLTELKGLFDAGALTPDEFEAAKRQVLGT